jgi:solute carrier family 6 GABA transporter-like protein 1
VLLRYISAPILAIIFGFAYPAFYQLRYDPLHIVGFTVAHFALIIVTLGFIVPRWYDVFIPLHRRGDGDQPTVANISKGDLDGESDENLENRLDSSSSDQEKIQKNVSEPAVV